MPALTEPNGAPAPCPAGSRWSVRAALAALCLLVAQQVLTRGDSISDDAWISMRYAVNLTRGDGLVWNPGQPPVEGYSNLLWVLAGAAGLAVGAPMVDWLRGLAIALWCASALLSYTAARTVGGSRPASLGAAALTACSAAISGAQGTGLEPPLVTALLSLGTALALREEAAVARGARPRPWSALAFGLLTLAHVEGPIYLGIAAFIRLSRRWSAPDAPPDRRADAARLALWLAPPLGQELVRVLYYHDWLPNPARIKLMIPMADASWATGIRYVAWSLVYNPALCSLVVLGVGSAALLRRGLPPAARIGALALATPWLATAAFSVAVKGDMLSQLRFMAPAVPSLMAMTAVGAERLIRRLPRPRGAAAALGLALWAAAAARQELGIWVITPNRTPATAPSRAEADLLDELGAPLGEVRLFKPPLGRLWGDAPRRKAGAVPWFLAWLLENVPPGAAVLFPDVGLVGFALDDVRVLDGRGLSSRGPARLLAAHPRPGPEGMYDPGVGAFLAEFSALQPAALVLQAMDERLWGPVEAALQGAGALDGYRGVATGPYTGQRRARLYTLDLEPPSAEVVLARYRRLAVHARGSWDWDRRLRDLERGQARPAEAGLERSEDVELYPAGVWSPEATGRPNTGATPRGPL